MLLADLGECADCGQDIGRAAFDRASHLLMRTLETAGPGTHHLVCSTPTENEQLLAVLHTERGTTGPAHLDSARRRRVRHRPRRRHRPRKSRRTRAPYQQPRDARDRVHGWRLTRGSLVPLTAGEVFSAYCTDADTGDPVSPESGVEYCAGFDIGADEPEEHR